MKKKEITHFPRQRQEDGERPMEKGAKLPAVRRCRDAFRYVSLFARGGGRAMSGVASCFFFYMYPGYCPYAAASGPPPGAPLAPPAVGADPNGSGPPPNPPLPSAPPPYLIASAAPPAET